MTEKLSMDFDNQADKAWLLNVQRKLYRWSKETPEGAYGDVWNWVTDPRNLRCAWRTVAGNKGKRTPGVDGLTVASIAAGDGGVPLFLNELREVLRNGSYRPSPARRKWIPKPGKPGKFRPLGIPTVADRVVLCAVKNILEPIFEARFCEARERRERLSGLINKGGWKCVRAAARARSRDEQRIRISCCRRNWTTIESGVKQRFRRRQGEAGMMSTRGISVRLAVLVVGWAFQGFAVADTIAVIGTGNVAGALGTEFAAQGHDIVYGSREPDRDEVVSLVQRTAGNASATTPPEAVVGADIVVLAVPGEVAEEVAASLGDLSGKIIIDPTNRADRGDDGVFRYTMETSNAELIQASAPGATVVKAFNALSFQTMIEPGGPVTVPLLGDNAEAKARVAELVSGMGLDPMDVGPLSEADTIEGLLAFYMNARMAGITFAIHFRRTPTN